MSKQVVVTVHSIAEDGLPDMDTLVGRVALIFDGCIASGWPLAVDPNVDGSPYSGLWEADTDVGHNQPMTGVTHWVEFPEPIWNYERREVSAHVGQSKGAA